MVLPSCPSDQKISQFIDLDPDIFSEIFNVAGFTYSKDLSIPITPISVEENKIICYNVNDKESLDMLSFDKRWTQNGKSSFILLPNTDYLVLIYKGKYVLLTL